MIYLYKGESMYGAEMPKAFLDLLLKELCQSRSRNFVNILKAA